MRFFGRVKQNTQVCNLLAQLSDLWRIAAAWGREALHNKLQQMGNALNSVCLALQNLKRGGREKVIARRNFSKGCGRISICNSNGISRKARVERIFNRRCRAGFLHLFKHSRNDIQRFSAITASAAIANTGDKMGKPFAVIAGGGFRQGKMARNIRNTQQAFSNYSLASHVSSRVGQRTPEKRYEARHPAI